jgi:tRNA(fMet)-specific endonuclease VapC
MERILIDTNAYSALMFGNSEVADILSRFDLILLSPIVYGELLDGFRGGRREKENRSILERFSTKPRTTHVPITNSTAEWFAEIKQILKSKGRPIPINDVWIAASCMEHGARLLSFDAHFEAVDGLLRYLIY